MFVFTQPRAGCCRTVLSVIDNIYHLPPHSKTTSAKPRGGLQEYQYLRDKHFPRIYQDLKKETLIVTFFLTHILEEMEVDMTTQVQNLDEADCISHSTLTVKG